VGKRMEHCDSPGKGVKGALLGRLRWNEHGTRRAARPFREFRVERRAEGQAPDVPASRSFLRERGLPVEVGCPDRHGGAAAQRLDIAIV